MRMTRNSRLFLEVPVIYPEGIESLAAQQRPHRGLPWVNAQHFIFNPEGG
jgi:hypothetical protein